MERKPHLDPRVGDRWEKTSGAGKNLSRKVVERVGGQITYENQDGQRRECWVSSWQTWVSGATLMESGV
jgi:hypothetical protein